MNKIYGDKATIKRAQEAKPGDKTVLINWDAIAELPEQYEVIVSEVKFDVQKDFSDVGNGNYMPTPDLCYKIAEAKGIKGLDGRCEAIYEDVDISEMTMSDIPVLQKILVGYSSIKQSTVMEEDGTERASSVCRIDYNVWNRVTEIWANEEKATEGYSSVVDGEYTAYNKKQSGPHYVVTKGKYTNCYPLKYGTKWDRKSHFKSELKFAMQKAETKAHIKTIRELAGLMTGYRMDDLKTGHMTFAKVRRSREALQLESLAKLKAMSEGKNEPIDLLFGDEPKRVEAAEEVNIKVETPDLELGSKTEPFEEYQKPEPEKTPKEKIVEAIEKYNLAGQIPENMVDTAESMLEWVEKQEKPEDNSRLWGKMLNNLTLIENEVPEEYRIKHGLY